MWISASVSNDSDPVLSTLVAPLAFAEESIRGLLNIPSAAHESALYLDRAAKQTNSYAAIDDLLQSVGHASAAVSNTLALVGIARPPVTPKTLPQPAITAKQPIVVTPQGVALPPLARYKILAHFVENPYRPGSYEEIVNGKFRERLRIDPATPPGMSGPNYSHYHLDGKGTHYSPRPGHLIQVFQNDTLVQ